MTTQPQRRLARWALAALLGLALPAAAARYLEPAPAWAMPDKDPEDDADDPAEASYDTAHDLLDEEEYEAAVEAFDDLLQHHPKSLLAGEAMYWKAFALFRLEDSEHLQDARKALLDQAKLFPKAATRRDSKELLIRIDGQLARMGDSAAAARLAAEGKRIGQNTDVREKAREAREKAREESQADRERARERAREAREMDDDDDQDTQMAALQALIQMNPDRALPILRKILARRDARSSELRSHALFLLAQNPSEDAQQLILDTVKNDPDIEVRKNGVFWLSQISSEAALDAIIEILRASPTEEVQENAVFALSQHSSPRAKEVLRDLAMDPKVSRHIRENAIFWIGQDGSESSLQFLMMIYRQTTEDDIKDKILFAISQHDSEEARRWLFERARDPKESMEIRKNAVFWLGQTGALETVDLREIYRTSDEDEMKQQIIFVASQQGSRASVDLLIEIAKNDPDKEMRQQAIFWLGQSGDDKAMDYLESLVGGE
jgi:HEAT repeat protein